MTARPPADAPDWLTDAVVARLAHDIRQRIPAAVQERGKGYALGGRVTSVNIQRRTITGEVRGTHPYTTQLTWTGERWGFACSCPVGTECKHAVALALVAVARLQIVAPPPAPPRTTRAADDLLAARTPEERAIALDALIHAHPTLRGLSAHSLRFAALLDDPDPEIATWRIARELRLAGLTRLPKPLDAWVDRPDLETRARERDERDLSARILASLGEPAEAPENSLRTLLRLSAAPDGTARVRLEVRVTTPRLPEVTRGASHLLQLAAEARARPNLWSVDDRQMLALLTGWELSQHLAASASRGLPGATLSRLLTSAPEGAAIVWHADVEADITRRAGVHPKHPPRVGEGVLRLQPVVVDRDGEPAIDVGCVWPDDTWRLARDVAEIEDAGEQDPHAQRWLLADGAVWRAVDDMPAALADALARSGAHVPHPSLRGAVLARLAASYPVCAEAIAPHIARREVTPAFLLDLADDGTLAVRLGAVARDAARETDISPAVEFWYTTGRAWERAEDAAPSGAWLDEADGPALESAIDWLAHSGAMSQERLQARRGRGIRVRLDDDDAPADPRQWSVKLTGRSGERFAAAWEERPPGIEWRATPRAARLLDGGAHIRPRMRVTSSGIDWLSVSAEWESDGEMLSAADLAALRRARTPYVKLRGTWMRRDVADAYDRAFEVLATLGVAPGEGEQRVSVWQIVQAGAAGLDALQALGGDVAETRDALERMREAVRDFRGVPALPPPAELRAELRAYQHLGFEMLAYATTLGLGVILADDMGLGKTVQALAWILWLRAQRGGAPHGPTLVVCPASVVHTWEREAARFAPGLRVLTLESGSERHARRDEIAAHDLVLTNYTLLRLDQEHLRAIDWHALVLDEAQNIKNPDADTTRVARSLRAAHRLALTGTPLENRALDLWSIAQVINPGYLGSRAAFEARYASPDTTTATRHLLAARLRPMLVRRLKEQVARDLPARIEERIDCDMRTGQRALYVDELTRGRQLLRDLAPDAASLRKNRMNILALLTKLRQICCHPALGGGKASLGSGKFDALFDLLEPILAEGHKVLVFSQFVTCLERVKTACATRHIPTHMLTGQTTRRAAVVDAFTNDPTPSVFLLSLKAGGTGLTLTAASYVVLLDPWWNPAVEAQAIDRAHRIGQTRTVIAYRLLTRGTIEERIWELQQRKAAMVRDILGEDGFAKALTREDLAYLLGE